MALIERRLVGHLASAVLVAGSLAIDRLGERVARLVQRRRLKTLLADPLSASPAPDRGRDPFGALRLLPVTDRTDIQADPDSFLAVEPDGPGVTVRATSGSSGVPVRIWSSAGDQARMRAAYLADLIALGLRPWDRIAYVRSAPFDRSPTARFGVLRSAHIDSRRPLTEQADAFLAARPSFVIGFPNVILSVAEELDRGDGPAAPVRRVVFGGEAVSDAAIDAVRRQLGASTGEVYASVEAGTIARSCRHGRLHVRTADVVVEVEDDDGRITPTGDGDLIVTVLNRRAMRFVRYRLGDSVRVVAGGCPCGNRSAVIAAIRGRTEDRVVTPDGRRVQVDFLTQVSDRFPAVRRQQIIQRNDRTIEVLVVLHRGADAPATLVPLGAALGETLAPFGLRCVVRAVPAVELSAGGKIRLVTSLVDQERPGADTGPGGP